MFNMNHNVALALMLCCFYGIADALWNGTVFAAYLKSINGDSNSAVGYVEGSSGLAGLITALPVGYLADKYKRSTIIFVGGIGVIITTALHVAVTLYLGDDGPVNSTQTSTSLYAFLIIMFLWGTVGGIVNGPVQALYADSTPKGERTTYYVYLFAAYTLSSSLGPALSIFMFQYWGDDWSIHSLVQVILVGMVFEILAAFVMFFFDDDKSLKEGEEEVIEEEGEEENKPITNAVIEDEIEDDIETDLDNGNESEDEGTMRLSQLSPEEVSLIHRRKRIPYLLLIFDIIFALGSGMSVKFFPLFFKDDVGLSPTNVQIIYLIIPISMVTASFLASKIATVCGRVQTIITFKLLGLGCLYAMIFVPHIIERPWIIAPVYVVRATFMNATYPLQESILMDNVKKNARARWKSLESVAQFGWCGSAVLGGILADEYDYTFTFLITAILQTIGVLGYFFLLPLVESEKVEEGSGSGSEKKKKKEDASGDDLTRPLLAEEEAEEVAI